MESEKLIEEMRKFPVLYNQSDEKYRNSEYKERVWKIISETLKPAGMLHFDILLFCHTELQNWTFYTTSTSIKLSTLCIVHVQAFFNLIYTELLSWIFHS